MLSYYLLPALFFLRSYTGRSEVLGLSQKTVTHLKSEMLQSHRV